MSAFVEKLESYGDQISTLAEGQNVNIEAVKSCLCEVIKHVVFYADNMDLLERHKDAIDTIQELIFDSFVKLFPDLMEHEAQRLMDDLPQADKYLDIIDKLCNEWWESDPSAKEFRGIFEGLSGDDIEFLLLPDGSATVKEDAIIFVSAIKAFSGVYGMKVDLSPFFNNKSFPFIRIKHA